MTECVPFVVFFVYFYFQDGIIGGRSWDGSLECTRNAACLNKLIF